MAEAISASAGVKDVEYFRIGKLVVSQLRLGKFMFYVTCALSIGFFFWFAGMSCPC